MEMYEVGGKLPAVSGKPEGVFFDIADDGAQLILNFARPTQREINAVQSSQPFDIKFVRLGDIIWMLTKCGSLAWCDAPYTPHLSPNLTKLDLPEEGQGLALIVILVDAATNTIKHLRAIGLGTDFSCKLISEIADIWSKPFNAAEYDAELSRVMGAYQTDALVKMARTYYKVR